jgi:hypothetical protein
MVLNKRASPFAGKALVSVGSVNALNNPLSCSNENDAYNTMSS